MPQVMWATSTCIVKGIVPSAAKGNVYLVVKGTVSSAIKGNVYLHG